MLDALRAGATLVCANNRLVRHWRGRYAAHWAKQAAIWPQADILPWGAWVRRLWQSSSWLEPHTPLLLDEHQAQRLWQDIIETEAPGLLHPMGAARLAQETWGLMQDWRLALPFAELECNEDALLFQRWAQRYAEGLARRGWVDEECLPGRLVEALEAGQLIPPARILLYGFEDWSPAQKALLETLARHGADIEQLAPPPWPDGGRSARRLAFADAASEERAAVRWARAWLERAPGSRLALVVPDLAARRARLVRLLDAELAPHTLWPGRGDAPRPWNISLGLPLDAHGMVRAAFHVFALGESRLALETLSQALLSPFLGGHADEREARALLDARLRASGEGQFGAEFIRRLAAERGCPVFGRLLAGLGKARAAEPRRQSPAAWAEGLRKALRDAGWPGDVPPDSPSFQLREAWWEALGRLARLELVRPAMTRDEALEFLRELAGKTLFQPQAAQDAPLQVLGPLEAIGLRFDAVWLMGMHHEQWPPEAHPNPFLPVRMQARLGMPHASPARELAYAQGLSQRLLELAPERLISHPLQEQGRELEASPLFAQLPLDTLEDISPAEGGMAEVALEELEDWQAPPLAEGARVGGGARVLELQSACPFRALAELRLGARPLEEPALGPDARQRGMLAHELMARLWGDLGDQQGLLALDEAALFERVQAHARQALDTVMRQHPSLWPQRLQALELARLTRLALEWLACERKRPPFSVEACERERAIEIGGIELAVKLDRVDRLHEGGRMLIDYKTGRATPGDWAGERPAAPQLPLYAVSMQEDDIRAIAFGLLRAGEARLQGLGDGIEGLKAAVPDWAAQLAAWQESLTALAQGFRRGWAAVDPRAPKVCAGCPLGMLCRIHELAGPGHALLEEEEDA